MQFQALRNFKSSEFGGTQYVEGLTYTIRPASEDKLRAAKRKTLAEMVNLWLNAQLFVPSEDIEIFGMVFKTGVASYCIDDAFAPVVKGWVEEGKAEYIKGGLVTFNTTTASSGITGAQ